MSQRLPDVIEEFVNSRLHAQGMAANTVRNERRTLDKLMAVIGPIQVRHISDRHIDQFLAERQAAGLQANTMNVHLQALRAFFLFCSRRGYVKHNPMANRRSYRSVPRQRLRVPAADFPRLLDATNHPRDRMLVAVGLYLWLRESEAIDLKIGDVDLADGEVAVRVHKTKQLDHMPICLELDTELRRWLTFYTQEAGPLTKDMYLLPAKGRPHQRDPITGLWTPGSPSHVQLRPHAKMRRANEPVQRALIKCGYPIRDESGRSNQEGMHTLRRSAARARYDYLVEQGYDGAMREVQAGLHHSSVQTTEIYLGLDLDRARRARNLRGRSMYGYAEAGNVVQLREQQRESSDQDRGAV